MDLKETTKGRFKFYCPLCGHHQKTKTAHGLGIKHHLQIGLATFVFSYFTWSLFGPKGILTYLVFWGLTEFFMRFQRRSQWICNECGFDPFLYKRDPNLMRQAVQNHIQDKINNDEKVAGIRFRNYKTPDNAAEDNSEAASSNEEENLSNRGPIEADSTLGVDNDFNLVDPSANIADVHRTESP